MLQYVVSSIIVQFDLKPHPEPEKTTVRTEGGWGEVYYYWTPCLHSHFGYGIDDPRNADLSLASGGRSRNEFVFANIMWDVTRNFQVAFEYSHWDTDYINPLLPDAEANVFHTRLQYSF